MAQEKLGTLVWDTELNTYGLETGLNTAKKSIDSTGTSLKSLEAVAKSVGGVLGIALTLTTVIQQLKECSQASIELEGAMIGLTRVAGRMGEDMDNAEAAARQLAADGLVSVSTAAEGLQKLMMSGLDLDTATELMEGYKDQAAFGRSATLSMDQAVGNLAESFYTGSSAIGNMSGQSENWNQIIAAGAKEIGKSVSALTEEEVVLAKVLGQRKLNAVVQGDAALAAETLAGKQALVSASTKTLQGLIGDALNPAVQELTGQLGQGLAGAIEWVNANMGSLQRIAMVTGSVLKGVIQIIVGLVEQIYYAGSAMVKVLTGDFAGAVSDAKRGATALSKAWIGAIEGVADAATKDIPKVERASVDALENVTDEAAEAAAKQKKQIDDLTEKYMEAYEKRKKSFEESLANMIWSHQDKVLEIKRQIEDENTKYAQTIAERDQNYSEKLADMVYNHQKKVNSVKKQIEDELQAEIDKNMKLEGEAQKRLDKEQKAYEEKVDALQKQIDREIAKGKNGSLTKIKDLEEQIKVETAKYEERTKEINEKLTEDVANNESATSKKLQDLEEKLALENYEYDQQLKKIFESNEQLTKKQAEEHGKRVSDYEEKLAEEERILELHAEDVRRVGEKMREDDITRLKRQYAEQNAEAEKQHQKQIAEAIKTGQEAGTGASNAVTTAVDTGLEDLPDRGNKAGKSLADGIKTGVESSNAWENLGMFVSAFLGRMVLDINAKLGGAISRAVNGAMSGGFNIGSFMNQYADGGRNVPGGLALVGERGPEIVELPRGSNVIPNHELGSYLGGNGGGGAGAEVNIYVQNMSSQLDLDMVGRVMGERLVALP